MKYLLCFVLAIATTSTLPVYAGCGACGPKPSQQADNRGHSHGEDLQGNMGAIGDLYKQLSRSLRNGGHPADAPKYLAQVVHLQEHVLQAKTQFPESVTSVRNAGEKMKLRKQYQATMSALLMESCKLEIALLNGDMAAAGVSIKALKSLKAKGHDAFIEEE